MKDERFPFLYRAPARTLSISGDALPTWTPPRVNIKFEESPKPVLIPIYLHGREAIGELFSYTVRMRTDIDIPSFPDNTTIDLDSIVGTQVTIFIDVPGKATPIPGMPGDTGRGNIGFYTREITGRVSAARFVRRDGRSMVYEFEVEPALAEAAKGSNYRIFMGETVTDVIGKILGNYPIAIDWRIGGPHYGKRVYPRRDLIRQHWEADMTSVQRLCEHYGLFYWFEHENGFHRIVIADTMGAFHPHGEAYEQIRFSTNDRIDEEHVDRLDVTSRQTEGKITVVDHDYTEPRVAPSTVPLREDFRDPRDTARADQEVYTYANVSQPRLEEARFDSTPEDTRDDARNVAMVRMQALRCQGLRAKGHGNIRGLTVGRTFHLTDHPYQKSNQEYLVVSATLTIEENDQASGTGQAFRCETDFEIQPTREYFRMPHKTPWPSQAGFEYAIVTGPENQEIWTDVYGRVKCQLIPDREGKLDQDAFIWVLPMQPWQNGQMGSAFVPRIGSQVLIGYVNGNPDMPFIVASSANKRNTPGWKLPFNQWVSGFRSRMEGGHSANHLALVDTKNELQAQLSSDHGTSQLSLGFIRRLLGNEGLKDARGEGFDLRTDFWGSVRAAMGIFITTHGRPNAEGKAKDAGETVTRLTQARDMHEGLVGLAQQHGAQIPDADQSDVTRSIKQQTADLRGTAKGGPNDFPEFATPLIALSSPAGIGTSTAGSTHIQSDEDTAITTGRSIGIAAGKSFHASVLERISLFVRKAGMMLVAASGKIRIEAQGDDIDVIAKKDVQITSEDGWINLTAMKGIRFNGAGTTVELSAAGLLGATNGKFLVHAADHSTDGPRSTPPAFAPKTYTDKSSLSHLYHDGEPVQGAKFDIRYDDGKRYSGTLDNAGHADLSSAPVGAGRMKIGPDSRPVQVKANEPNPDYKPKWGESDFRASANKQNNGDA
ncbi:type VI secretion system tip protein TssI/VgrG [Paraburkholderia phymatum]|uniref:Type VI secretion system Vgr family protein n=1 Tax=Paraburkholderia phymatum (strain DSM 17167 / CIP 108236 / LMG 21445 / STM815) TaxID=391038 RepID=B2JMI2_PARP8|nr:type VI secretion system Vgr family protein [Paraburkholderia phymatum]ACC72776.1 type VI secretion system Vgr family protein [Paraburkholderia phymatum STM815]